MSALQIRRRDPVIWPWILIYVLGLAGMLVGVSMLVAMVIGDL